MSLIGVALVVSFLSSNTRACYFAKGIKASRPITVYYDKKIIPPYHIVRFSIGDYYACANIGEQL